MSISAIISNIGLVISAATGVCAAASAIAAITPTPKDDSFWKKASQAVDILALNVWHAKEK